MTPALAVLLKAPRLGTVKTRLAAEIGARQALRLYRVLVHRTLAEVRVAGLEATVWFTPADAVSSTKWGGPRATDGERGPIRTSPRPIAPAPTTAPMTAIATTPTTSRRDRWLTAPAARRCS